MNDSVNVCLPVNFVRITVFCALTGYTRSAVESKVKEGVWREGREYQRAPDGHILIDLEGYHAWVRGKSGRAM